MLLITHRGWSNRAEENATRVSRVCACGEVSLCVTKMFTNVKRGFIDT